MISAELSTFLESGVSVLVGTRDARLVPESTRAVGARVEEGGASLTVFLPDATSTRALVNLRENGCIAVCVSRAADHRSIQVKGRALEVREGQPADRAAVERWLAEIAASWQQVGFPAWTTRRMACWPCHAVRLRIEEVFVQTPGPGAGAPLAGAGR